MSFRRCFLFLVACMALSSCAQDASWHSQQVAQQEKQNFTIGVVQKDIKEGMTGAQVAEVLGSPNIVSTDENGNEVWIYDKFYTEGVASASNGITLGLSNIAGGAVRTSQSTITIIIKFNADNQVRNVAYHKSSF